LGAKADLTAGDLRWLSPLPLWTGILAGPIAWSCNLGVSYALVKSICISQRHSVLQLITAACLIAVACAAVVSWTALQHTQGDRSGDWLIEGSGNQTDGGEPRQRARFMAVLGLMSSTLSAIAIVALAVPHWMLNACQ
jgi:hypothetical protein